jgi:hypothetical protein
MAIHENPDQQSIAHYSEDDDGGSLWEDPL